MNACEEQPCHQLEFEMPILEEQEFEDTPGLEKRKIRKKKEDNGKMSKW